MMNRTYIYNIKKLAILFLIVELLFWGAFYFLWSVLSSGNSSDNTFLFKSPHFLYLSFFIFVFYFFNFYKLIKWNKLVKTVNFSGANSFFQKVNNRNTFWKIFLIRNTIFFLVIALAHPIYGEKKEEGVKESMEIVIAMDISNSMNAKDIDKRTSRLEVAKRSVIQLINSFNGQKIGVCVFAGGAYVQLPLTNDYPIAKMFINEIETGMLSNQGTNVAQAFKTSLEMFSEDKTTKAIIMVTDGENHEVNPSRILSKIKEADVKVCVLGIGTKRGGLVPVNPYRLELGYKLGEDGKYLMSKVNPKFLKSIASQVNGYATLTSNPFPNLSQLVDEIKKMKKKKHGSYSLSIKADRYQLPLLISIVFFLLYFMNSFKRKLD